MPDTLPLAILASLDGETDTVTLRQRVGERLGREVSIGALYAALARLEEENAIGTRNGEELIPKRGHRPRRYVWITRTGEWMLQEKIDV